MSAVMALYEELERDPTKNPLDYVSLSYLWGFHRISILDTKRKSRHRKREDARIEHIVKKKGIYRNFTEDFNEWVLPVKEVLYYQGWHSLFKPRLFKHSESIFYAADKERMAELFMKYVNLNPKEGNIEIYKEFMNSFKEGMIFEIAF